jgi:hypothetical protein
MLTAVYCISFVMLSAGAGYIISDAVSGLDVADRCTDVAVAADSCTSVAIAADSCTGVAVASDRCTVISDVRFYSSQLFLRGVLVLLWLLKIGPALLTALQCIVLLSLTY